MKAEGVEPGIPDIFISVPKKGLSGVYIEMKSKDPKAKLSDAQKVKIQLLRQYGYQVYVCIVECDILGKGTPVGKAGLELMIAYLMVPGVARPTMTTASNKWNRHAVSFFPLLYSLSYRSYDTGQFMTWHMW